MTLGDRRTAAREALSARLRADVVAFEASGGRIQRVARGATLETDGDPLRKRTGVGRTWLFGPAKPGGGKPGPKPKPRPPAELLDRIFVAAGVPAGAPTTGAPANRHASARRIAILAMRAVGASWPVTAEAMGMSRSGSRNAGRRASDEEREAALSLAAALKTEIET